LVVEGPGQGLRPSGHARTDSVRCRADKL